MLVKRSITYFCLCLISSVFSSRILNKLLNKDKLLIRRGTRQVNWNSMLQQDFADSIIFEDKFNEINKKFTTSNMIFTTSPTVAIPGMGTARSRCEDRCRTTSEYNPICGNNGITYSSMGRLKCAQLCGKKVQEKHQGACPRTF